MTRAELISNGFKAEYGWEVGEEYSKKIGNFTLRTASYYPYTWIGFLNRYKHLLSYQFEYEKAVAVINKLNELYPNDELGLFDREIICGAWNCENINELERIEL